MDMRKVMLKCQGLREHHFLQHFYRTFALAESISNAKPNSRSLTNTHTHTQFYQHIIRVLTYLYHLCIATHSARFVPTENLDFEQFYHSNWICMANGDLPHEKHAKNSSRSMSWILFVGLKLCMSWSFSLIAFSISFSPPSKIVWSLLLLVQFAHFYCV